MGQYLSQRLRVFLNRWIRGVWGYKVYRINIVKDGGMFYCEFWKQSVFYRTMMALCGIWTALYLLQSAYIFDDESGTTMEILFENAFWSSRTDVLKLDISCKWKTWSNYLLCVFNFTAGSFCCCIFIEILRVLQNIGLKSFNRNDSKWFLSPNFYLYTNLPISSYVTTESGDFCVSMNGHQIATNC